MKALALLLAATLCLQAQSRPQRFSLPNGLRVVLLEDHQRPLVRACLHLELNPADMPPDQSGLAPLFLRMFDQSSAGDMDAGEIEMLLESSGIQTTRTLGARSLEWRFLSRGRDQDRGLGLLADRLLRTILNPGLLEAQQQACWLEEEQLQASPRAFLRASLSSDPGLRPTRRSLGAIKLEDLLAFRARAFRPDRAILILHGDLGVEQAKRLVMLSLGTWVAQAVAPAGEPSKGTAPLDGILHLPGSNLRPIAQVVAPRPADLSPECEALLALLVAGAPAMGPAEAVVKGHALVTTYVGGTDATADMTLAKLLKWRGALRQRGFTQAELDQAKTVWRTRLPLASLHPDAMIEAALEESLGRGLSPDRLLALTLETLNTDLRHWLDSSAARTGVIGRAVTPARP